MSACGMGSLHIWKGTINAERYIQVLEQHMLPSRHRLFQGRPCIFQHDNARPHTASITTSWLRRRRIRVLKWPACSLSPIENIWRIIKRKMRQRRHKTVEQLEAYIRQEWDNIPIPKLEQLVSSVPRLLQTVIKRRGDATQYEHNNDFKSFDHLFQEARHIQWIKGDSKDIHIKISIYKWNHGFHKILSSTTVFNIDNNKICFLSSKSAY